MMGALTIVGDDHVGTGQGWREAQARGLSRLGNTIARFSCQLARLCVSERSVHGDCRFHCLQWAEVGRSCRWMASSWPLHFFLRPSSCASFGNCQGCRHLKDSWGCLCGWGRPYFAFFLERAVVRCAISFGLS